MILLADSISTTTVSDQLLSNYVLLPGYFYNFLFIVFYSFKNEKGVYRGIVDDGKKSSFNYHNSENKGIIFSPVVKKYKIPINMVQNCEK